MLPIIVAPLPNWSGSTDPLLLVGRKIRKQPNTTPFLTLFTFLNHTFVRGNFIVLIFRWYWRFVLVTFSMHAVVSLFYPYSDSMISGSQLSIFLLCAALSDSIRLLQKLPIAAVKQYEFISMRTNFHPVFIVYIAAVIDPQYWSSTRPAWSVNKSKSSANIWTEISFTWNGMFVLVRHKFDLYAVTLYMEV